LLGAVVILWCPKVPNRYLRRLKWQKHLNTSVHLGRFGLVELTLSISLPKLLAWSLTVYFAAQNKASKSEEHRPMADPEVILCVEVYEKRYGSVKVIYYPFVTHTCFKWKLHDLRFLVIPCRARNFLCWEANFLLI
jgi:hypothetical protein